MWVVGWGGSCGVFFNYYFRFQGITTNVNWYGKHLKKLKKYLINKIFLIEHGTFLHKREYHKFKLKFSKTKTQKTKRLIVIINNKRYTHCDFRFSFILFYCPPVTCDDLFLRRIVMFFHY